MLNRKANLQDKHRKQYELEKNKIVKPKVKVIKKIKK